jgi:hypothetical protein
MIKNKNIIIYLEEEEEEEILKKIKNVLPDVLLDIIWIYLPHRVKIFLNKNYYIQYHSFFYENILIRNKENFIRFIIRSDNYFVFQQLLTENYKKWINDIKNYKYQNFLYKSYIYFLKDFCLFHESFQCINTLHYFLEKHNLCQNQHKKNTVRNIRWKI